MKEAESEKYNSLQKHVTEYQKAGENFMASSMIHLAIIRCIIVKTEFNNLDRLRPVSYTHLTLPTTPYV